jgi:phosphatidylinositol dimannoside acyltransferase
MNVQRLRNELRDLVEVGLLPGLAAVLPWRVCFAVFKWLSRRQFLYREPCERALVEAAKRGWAADPQTWIAHRRLVTLVDHSDHYLTRTRSDAWMAKHLNVQGSWPAPSEASLQLTFHWGAGMWALRHAHASGLKAHMLVAGVNGKHFLGHFVLHHYIRARTRSIALALRQPTVDVSVSLRPVLRALRANEQVIAVIDVPADQVSASQTIDLLGMQARIPTALIRVAVEQGTPVNVFLTGIDMSNGRRFLRIQPLGVHDDLNTLIQVVFKVLENAIRDDAAAWHFWSESERFFVNHDN